MQIAAPKSSVHDAILYAFYRTCGGPASDWLPYLKRITALKPSGHRAPYTKRNLPLAPPPLPFKSSDPHPWADVSVRYLSLRYLNERITEQDAARLTNEAERALIATNTGVAHRGALRHLHHTRARHYAAIVRALPDPHRHHPPAPPVTTDQELYVHMNAERLAKARMQHIRAERKLNDILRQLSLCQTTYEEAKRRADNLLLTHRRAQAKHEANLIHLRQSDPNARVPKVIAQATSLARLNWTVAQRERNAAHRSLRAAKARLTKSSTTLT